MALLARLLVRLLPPAFRRRYGDELAATLCDARVTPAVLGDLALSAVREWVRVLRPSSGPAESRLRHAVATSFAAGVAGLVSLLVFARAVDDRPVPGLSGWALHLYGGGAVVVEVVGAVAGAVAVPYWVRAVVSGARRRDGRALASALRPLVVTAAWLGLASLLGRGVGRIHLAGVERVGVLVAFGTLTVAAAAWCVRDARRAFASTPWGARELRVALAVARASAVAGDALALVVLAITVRVLVVGGSGAWSAALAVGSLCVLVVASSIATVSTLGRPRSAPAP